MTQRCCQLWFINYYAPLLRDDAGDLLHSRWRAGCWQMAWNDSLLDIFMPTVESFCPLQHCSATWGAVPSHTHGCQPTMDVGNWLTFLPQEAYGPYLTMIFTFHCPRQRSLTDAIVPQERNLCHPPYHILGDWSTTLTPWHNFGMARCLRWNVINTEYQSFMNSPHRSYKCVANYCVVFHFWLTSMWN